MKKASFAIALLGALLLMMSAVAYPVYAYPDPKSTIRLDPANPITVESPATFEVYVNDPNDSPTTDPYILLVMTKASYDSLSGVVEVSWTGGSIDIPKDDFTGVLPTDGKIPPIGEPPGGTDEGDRYSISSFQSHLGVPPDEPVYYALKPFLPNDITTEKQEFTVTLPSDATRMLVYVLGKCGGSSSYNNRVPPTEHGFIIPELGPLLLTLASFSALGLYTIKRRKQYL